MSTPPIPVQSLALPESVPSSALSAPGSVPVPGTVPASIDPLSLAALPAEPFVLLAFVLLAGGVVGSVVPVLPGGLLSLAGIYCYWWASGFSEPGLLLLSGLTFAALVVVAVSWLAGAVSAKAGGASTRTTVLATVAGLAGLLLAGPVGFLAGTAGTVFALEYADSGDAVTSARAAKVTLLGVLTSSLVELLMTAGILVVMVWVALA